MPKKTNRELKALEERLHYLAEASSDLLVTVGSLLKSPDLSCTGAERADGWDVVENQIGKMSAIVSLMVNRGDVNVGPIEDARAWVIERFSKTLEHDYVDVGHTNSGQRKSSVKSASKDPRDEGYPDWLRQVLLDEHPHQSVETEELERLVNVEKHAARVIAEILRNNPEAYTSQVAALDELVAMDESDPRHELPEGNQLSNGF